MKNKTILQIRDIMILHVLAGFGVARSVDLTYLAGFNNASYLRRRLSMLMKQKLVASIYYGREKIYYLTSLGYAHIHRMHTSYTVNSQTLHDIGVARISSYLYLSEGVSFYDFITDRQLYFLLKNSPASVHRPDIVLGNKCYEYERSIKNYKRLKANIQANAKYERQIWIVDAENHRLQKKIPELARDCLAMNVEVWILEELDAVVASADLSKNVLRSKNKLGERNFNLVLSQNTNRKFESYFTRLGGYYND